MYTKILYFLVKKFNYILKNFNENFCGVSFDGNFFMLLHKFENIFYNKIFEQKNSLY